MRARVKAARRKVARKRIIEMRRVRRPEVEPAPAIRAVGHSERRETGL